MIKIKTALLYAVITIIAMAGCATAPVQDTSGEWVPIRVFAKGGGAPPANAINQAQARLMAERAARADAMRNLLEQTYGVNIKSRTTVRDFVAQSDSIKTRVDSFIKGARVINTQYLRDGSVEVEMEMILGHEFRGFFP